VNGKRLVIDASVALKWRLRDEEATSQADALLDDFLAGKLELLTPTLFDNGPLPQFNQDGLAGIW
jgi:hypothetical protein